MESPPLSLTRRSPAAATTYSLGEMYVKKKKKIIIMNELPPPLREWAPGTCLSNAPGDRDAGSQHGELRRGEDLTELYLTLQTRPSSRKTCSCGPHGRRRRAFNDMSSVFQTERSLLVKFAFAYVDIFIRFIVMVKDRKSHARDWAGCMHMSKWERHTRVTKGIFKLAEFEISWSRSEEGSEQTGGVSPGEARPSRVAPAHLGAPAPPCVAVGQESSEP